MLRGLGFLAIMGISAITLGFVLTHNLEKEAPLPKEYPFVVGYNPKAHGQNSEKLQDFNDLDDIKDDPVYLMFLDAQRKMLAKSHHEVKRSLAIGRNGWRPGKRSNNHVTQMIKKSPNSFQNHMFWLPNDYDGFLEEHGQPEEVYEGTPYKRSLAIGRSQWRPGKRAMPFSQDFMFDYGYRTIFMNEDHPYLFTQQ